jgi:hypothetical protein
VLFFYDGPISQAVAFEGILGDGRRFADRLLSGFSSARGRSEQLVHIATDGESYGHHHKHGEMALSYALHHLEANGLAQPTNYGAYLEGHPPTHLVRIFEHSSWSCVHGVERWRADCGCNSGGHGGWNQGWRGPLREALDWLRDAVAAPYERRGGELFADPWAARDGYVDVVLDRSRGSLDRFFGAHARRPLVPEEETEALRLLELQRHAMLMYTSCGWFFDEVSGLETTQVLQYAGRVVQLAAKLFGGDGVEGEFLDRLERAPSNLPEHGTARGCYEKFVRPATIDLLKVGGHYAISSLFESYAEKASIFCYDVRREDYQVLSAGNARLALGRARVCSGITHDEATLSFGVLHLGDHNVSGGVREYRGEEAYAALVGEIGEIFHGADLPEIIRAVDRNFGGDTYSLKLLFRDEQRRILGSILEKTLGGTEGVFSQIYGQHAPLMRFLADLGHPLPAALRCVAETALNTDLRRALAAEEPDAEQVKGLVAEAAREGAALDATGLGFTMRTTLGRLGHAWRERPEDLAALQRLARAVTLVHALPFEVVFWDVQNIFFLVRVSTWPGMSRRAGGGDDAVARAWTQAFLELGERLGIRPPEPPAP